MIHKQKVQKLVFFVLLTVISSMVLGSFLAGRIDGYNRARFEEMIEGKAYKPFVNRCLVPFIIRTGREIMPDTFRTDINRWGGNHIAYLTEGENNILLTDFILALIIWFISLFGFAFGLIKLAENMYSFKKIHAYVLAVISVAGLPVFFKYYGYIYDFPDLFLFTLCLYFLSSGKWNAYIITFILATFNKETSILLILVYFIYFRRTTDKKYFNRFLTVQLVFYILIKGVIELMFFRNPGSMIEFHLFHNLSLAPYSLAQFAVICGAGILIIKDWKEKPYFLRTASVIIIPLLILTFFFGYIDEYRDYYEVYPVIILLMAYSVGKITGLKDFHVQVDKIPEINFSKNS